MRVCVLKEYLGSKNNIFLLTTHANKHTHTHVQVTSQQEIFSSTQEKVFHSQSMNC
jgi:hypothetical protein